jgi:hypothetical protein
MRLAVTIFLTVQVVVFWLPPSLVEQAGALAAARNCAGIFRAS